MSDQDWTEMGKPKPIRDAELEDFYADKGAEFMEAVPRDWCPICGWCCYCGR